MRVVVVGSGYVGLVTAVGLAAIGHDVTCVDRDDSKVEAINAGRPPIYERGLEELLSKVIHKQLRATTDLSDALTRSEISIIAVGTPFDGARIDLRFIRQVAREIGKLLPSCEARHTVVVKSTVVPGTTEHVVLPLLEQASGLQAGLDFGLAMNPEFLREGDAIADFMSPDRIVVGGIDAHSCDTLEQLYQPFKTTVIRTTPSTGEMIKYTSNALLASLISFSNEIANLSSSLGVDATDVMRAVHLDKRLSPVGPDGETVRPGVLAYLAGGCGFGGSCFDKDARALIARANEFGHEMPMLRAAIDINDAQPLQMVELLRTELPDLTGRRIAILGLAFKPDTSDIRESPALPIIEELLDNQADIVVHDPQAHDEAHAVLGSRVDYATDMVEAVNGAEAIMIVTGWDVFRRLPDLLADRTDQPLVVDGRRLLPKESVARYRGIGV